MSFRPRISTVLALAFLAIALAAAIGGATGTSERAAQRGEQAGHHDPRGRRGPRGRSGPRGPTGPPGPTGPGSHGGYGRDTRVADIVVAPGASAEGAATCRDEEQRPFYPSGTPLGGGAYFLGAPPEADVEVTASAPGAVDPAGAADSWMARATNASDSPQTLRIFVHCYAVGP
jgi:hypothetical protein